MRTAQAVDYFPKYKKNKKRFSCFKSTTYAAGHFFGRLASNIKGTIDISDHQHLAYVSKKLKLYHWKAMK